MSKATEVKQRNYLEALLTSSNKTEACKKAHISRTTANRYENDPDASPSDKTRAAKIILDAGFHVQETQDILQRLDNLESEVNG